MTGKKYGTAQMTQFPRGWWVTVYPTDQILGGGVTVAHAIGGRLAVAVLKALAAATPPDGLSITRTREVVSAARREHAARCDEAGYIAELLDYAVEVFR